MSAKEAQGYLPFRTQTAEPLAHASPLTATLPSNTKAGGFYPGVEDGDHGDG
jgi:hypothetical protein